ncbi:uncharacterized protein LOC132201143 [Neocloeon triangulifer]|uniref:uncharacterized protein LOC132201143 n=1 Tax=Neocloeon triangulifer TaxID=2078957 RepID=UPI00286ECFF5|nr:uncharacterized protein LOC132201143 [Neocloeon triangulifer]
MQFAVCFYFLFSVLFSITEFKLTLCFLSWPARPALLPPKRLRRPSVISFRSNMLEDQPDGLDSYLPATICGFRWRSVMHLVDAAVLLVVHLVQASVLNYYIISHYSHSTLAYLWFAADFICLFVFAGTLTVAFKYFSRPEHNTDSASFTLSPDHFINGFPTSRFGVLPLSYVSWLFYSAILIAKVAVIYRSDLPEQLHPKDLFGPQLLQVTIALGAVVFLLLAESHNWARHRSPRYQFVTSTCAHSGLAVLDTVSLLSVLLPQDANRATEPPELLMDLILALCLFNLLLPAMALYRLGLSEPSAAKAQQSLVLPFSVLHDITHFLLVDLPFLGIRSYLWIGHRQHTSLFMMKNVLGIMVTVRGLHPDLYALFKRRRRRQQEEEEKRQQGENLLEVKQSASTEENRVDDKSQ